MERHWTSYCTLSIVHFMAFPECLGGEGPILETLAKIAEDAFFSGVEVGPMKDPGTRKEAARLIEQSHLRVSFGAQPAILLGKLNLNSLDPDQRAEAVAQVKARIDQAAEVGARRVAILSGPDPGAADRPKAIEALIDSVKQLCAYAGERGLGITLETFDRDVDKKALIGPSDEAASFAKAVRAEFPDFGLMYDLSHQPLLGEESLPALTLLKDHLVHAHVGNCVKVPGRPAYGDQHPRFGFPGGENDVEQLTAFLKALFAIGYLKEPPDADGKPWIGIEVRPQPGESSAAVIANAKRVWQEAWTRA